jgi:hypothetical protein
MDKVPELQGSSPLSGIKPVMFTVNRFKDATAGEGIVGQALQMDRQVNDIVRQAIINELIRDGHQVSSPEYSSKANAVIDGTVRTYWVLCKQKIFLLLRAAHVLGHVKADITIRFLDSGTVLTKSYDGASDVETYKGLTKETGERALNEALLNMLKDFTMDPDFLDGLNKLSQVLQLPPPK